MIESNLTAESRVSAVRCMESLRGKIEMFMRAGDIIDHTTSGRSTKEETRIAREKALKIWKETNCTISQAARLASADRGSFYKWLIEQGHHLPKSK